MVQISGLTLLEDYITFQQESNLAAHIDAQPWLTQLRRRVQHYGYIYDYKRRNIDHSMRIGALPDWLMPLTEQMHTDELFSAVPDQCIVNEYEPGQGISPHVDCEPCFGDVIASLTLLSGCVMNFSHVDEDWRVSLFLPRRSLLVMRGEARYQWKHGIPPRLTDKVGCEVVRRERRLSITCRSVVVTDGTN